MLIAGFSPIRLSEFRAGCACLRRCFSSLGIAAGPVLTDAARELLLPLEVYGAVTHTDRFCAVAVMPICHGYSIGIDAETDAPLLPGVDRLVLRPEERILLRKLDDFDPATHWDRLIFSAKESFYKAQFWIYRRWLNFHDVGVTIYPEDGIFKVRSENSACNIYVPCQG